MVVGGEIGEGRFGVGAGSFERRCVLFHEFEVCSNDGTRNVPSVNHMHGALGSSVLFRSGDAREPVSKLSFATVETSKI